MSGGVDKYFSVIALFILFRETIEASIICGVLLQFLARSKPALKRTVWWGVIAGVGVSILFGVIFIVVYYTAQNNLFKGKNRDIFKGVVSWIAAGLITYLGFAMLRFLGWEKKWQRRLEGAVIKKLPLADADQQQQQPDSQDAGKLPADAAAPVAAAADAAAPVAAAADAALPPAATAATELNALAKRSNSAPYLAGQPPAAVFPQDHTGAPQAAAGMDVEAGQEAPTAPLVDMSPATRSEWWNIWILVFTTVMREGIESVVFLGGLGNVKLTAVPLAALVGISAGVLVGIFLFYTGRQVKDLKWFIIIMTVIIFFIAAGQISLGTDAFIRVGVFGHYSVWYDERPWRLVPLYDWSHCCADTDPNGTEPTSVQNTKRFFSLVRAIFGYQDQGTFMEIMLYCSWWILIIVIGLWSWWRGSLFDADWKHTRAEKALAKEAQALANRSAEEEAAAAAKVVALEEASHAARGGTSIGTPTTDAVSTSSQDGKDSAPARESGVVLSLAPAQQTAGRA